MAIFITGDVHGGAELPVAEWRDDCHCLGYRDIIPIETRRRDEDREPVGSMG